MGRHSIRKQAFELLFSQEINNYEATELLEINEEFCEEETNPEVKALFVNTVLHKEELDAIITKYSQKRSIQRIGKSALSLLRLALYEIIYDEKVPTSVAINEAVVLAKEYCDQPDVSFINGLLGAYSRSENNDSN